MFVGSYYALYFSGLFAAALPVHGAHVFMNLHFLVSGLLFFWPLIGIDPAPRRLPPAARLGVVFASVPFHAFFGVALMSAGTVIGGAFYRALALPWVTDPLRDQQLGGGLAWASGELPLLLVVIVLLVQWSRQDERSARRDDRRADADGDADLVAYNAMLRRLATGGTPSGADDELRPGSHDAVRRDGGRAGAARGAVRRLVLSATSALVDRLAVRSRQPACDRLPRGRPFVAREDRRGAGLDRRFRRSERCEGGDLTLAEALA